jgi:hypothetical protein
MAVSFLLAARSRFSVFSVGDYRPAAPQKWGTHISLISGVVNRGLRGQILSAHALDHDPNPVSCGAYPQDHEHDQDHEQELNYFRRS